MGGFEYQIEVKNRYAAADREYLWLEKHGSGGAGEEEQLRLAFEKRERAREAYERAMSPLGLDDALDRLGGYFPLRLDGNKVQTDWNNAVEALRQSYISGYGGWVRQKVVADHPSLLERVTADRPYSRWEQYNEQLKERGWCLPGTDRRRVEPRYAAVFPGLLQEGGGSGSESGH